MKDLNIKISNVSKSFISSSVNTQILHNISLELTSGETVAIVGSSGSGKSTLLSIIGTLDSPSEGSLFFGTKEISKMTQKEVADVRFQHIGFIFQQFHLVNSLTVLENVLSPLMMRKVNYDKKERAMALLSRVGLEEHVHKLPSQLSGGQQQRVAIARALINQPSWILADEPTGNLDSETGKRILSLLLELQVETGCGLIIVTHDENIAHQMDRIIKIQDGSILSYERRAITQ